MKLKSTPVIKIGSSLNVPRRFDHQYENKNTSIPVWAIMAGISEPVRKARYPKKTLRIRPWIKMGGNHD